MVTCDASYWCLSQSLFDTNEENQAILHFPLACSLIAQPRINCSWFTSLLCFVYDCPLIGGVRECSRCDFFFLEVWERHRRQRCFLSELIVRQKYNHSCGDTNSSLALCWFCPCSSSAFKLIWTRRRIQLLRIQCVIFIRILILRIYGAGAVSLFKLFLLDFYKNRTNMSNRWHNARSFSIIFKITF